jgi:uncharacterized protein (DUF1015 family)
MARIEPFKGLRPRKEIAYRVASPPYDVLNSEEARKMAADNEFSFLHITKPEIDLPEDVDLYSDRVYQKARENFQRFIREKILIQDKEKLFYLYKQIWGNHTQVGLVAGASIQDYQNDVIKKHEHTREDKEKDRMRHIETLNANTGPVFLTFKQKPEIDILFETAMKRDPEFRFSSADGIQHIFYLVDDSHLIRRIQTEFSKLERLYVADGHHRSAAATSVKIAREKANKNHTGNEEYNFFLSVIFPHNQMKILAYNRVVKNLDRLCKAEFFHEVEKNFTFGETDSKHPTRPHEFCLYLSGKWYVLRAKPDTFDSDDPVDSLDVSILQKNLLHPVLGIANPRTDNRLDFVGGIRTAEELENQVESGSIQMAITLYPTSIEQLFKVADAGKVMPPKSTWFEPKLKSGLVIHLLND